MFKFFKNKLKDTCIRMCGGDKLKQEVEYKRNDIKFYLEELKKEPKCMHIRSCIEEVRKSIQYKCRHSVYIEPKDYLLEDEYKDPNIREVREILLQDGYSWLMLHRVNSSSVDDHSGEKYNEVWGIIEALCDDLGYDRMDYFMGRKEIIPSAKYYGTYQRHLWEINLKNKEKLDELISRHTKLLVELDNIERLDDDFITEEERKQSIKVAEELVSNLDTKINEVCRLLEISPYIAKKTSVVEWINCK